MHINLNNLTGIKKSFFNYEVGNLFRLVSKNSYPRLGSDFKFVDQDNEGKPFEPYYKKNILPHVEIFELKRVESLKNLRKRNIIAIPIQIIIVESF